MLNYAETVSKGWPGSKKLLVRGRRRREKEGVGREGGPVGVICMMYEIMPESLQLQNFIRELVRRKGERKHARGGEGGKIIE